MSNELIPLSNPLFLREGWHWKRRRLDVGLSKRETELMVAIMQGATTHAEMAERLVIGRKTIQTMLNVMFLKTGARNVADLILWQIKQD